MLKGGGSLLYNIYILFQIFWVDMQVPILLTPDTLLAKNYLKIHYYAEGKSELKSGKI